MRKRTLIGIGAAVFVVVSVLGALPSGAQDAPWDPDSPQCHVWLPYIERDLKEARVNSGGEFPAVWPGLLQDGRGNLVEVPYSYFRNSAETVTLQPDTDRCGGEVLPLILRGSQLDQTDYSALDEGPFALRPTTTTSTTILVPSTTIAQPVPTTASPSTTQAPAVLGETQTGACDPNYSGVCVPIAPPNTLNCDDIDGNNFQVVGVDIHRLDEGGEPGIACESKRVATRSATGRPVATALAMTGSSRSFDLGVAASALLVLGMFLIVGGAATPETRARGGFTVTTNGPNGPVTMTIAKTRSRRRK